MNVLNFTPFSILKTGRLLLREPSLDDRNETYFMRSDERVNKYVDRPRPANVADAEQFIQKLKDGISKNESIAWVISLKNDPKLIGSICLWNISEENSTAEIGFELHPDHQGKGIMQEALLPVLHYGFNSMQLKIIEGWAHERNTASIKLMEKNNFVRDHETESKFAGEDYFKNMQIFALSRSSWNK